MIRISLDFERSILADLDLTEEQLMDAVCAAVRCMKHPEDGGDMYVNKVSAFVDYSQVS